MKMSTEEFEEHQDSNSGYCTECEKITTQDVEPDAEGYNCPECDGQTVMGMDNALILEHVEINDEDSEDEDEEENQENYGSDGSGGW